MLCMIYLCIDPAQETCATVDHAHYHTAPPTRQHELQYIIQIIQIITYLPEISRESCEDLIYLI